jgi:exonuclease III
MARGAMPLSISFAIQNCNSLNVSTSCEKQLKKVSSILLLNTTFIFLCDLRLGSGQSSDEIKKNFACNKIKNYDFFHNSTRNSRGVGILIDKNFNCEILDEFRDANENILGLKVKTEDCTFWLASIYGPNNNDNEFFNRLQALCRYSEGLPMVFGGDWNATICTLNNADNIDTLNMHVPPSNFRSQKIQDLSHEGQLTDPFRALWPGKRDFTYVPRTGRNNRSRLDFFLISDSILDTVSDCNIAESLSCSLFDHKSVTLRLGNATVGGSNVIFNSTINHSRFMDIVTTSITDTYLNHAAPDTVNLAVHQRMLGTAFQLIRDLNNLEQEIEMEGISEQRTRTGEQLREQLDFALRSLPGTETLINLNLTADPDIFFEVLCSNLKNNVCSFQGWLKKIETCSTNHIKKTLLRLKSSYLDNSEVIFELERRLTNIHDRNLSSKVSGFKIFENLNSEKPTPAFVAIAKNRSMGKLHSIKKPDGSAFLDDNDRNEYIRGCFQELYMNRDPDHLPDDIIETFLGPEILNSDLVRNSKLSNDESAWLDRPLTLAELDISVKKGKLRSAPGADGFSNLFINRCWPHLRYAFFNYANFCLDKGILTHNFRSASIRLIPKKGEQSQLKNWRPISLLSNFYKILSRAINTRLNKFVNRICSRSQKGYNNARHTQEVLVNVWEQINYCKLNNIKGAVVAIDMAKAFDTLSHLYLKQVYKFFNFGPRITAWLDLLGNQREACILLDNNKKTPFFRLGRGRPQGDNISPNTFNFAVQILIFKLELDPMIAKIPRPLRNINNKNENNTCFAQESNRETGKNESLADDNTTLTIMDQQSLPKVRDILNSFAAFSGLVCNFDKSCVLFTYDPDPADINLATGLGFTIADSIKLLGVTITKDLDNIHIIFNEIIDKIIRSVSFWERFKLSLPGRIIIAKTYLVSQLNYIGCFLKPPDDILDRIQVIINNFVKKNINISQVRVTKATRIGGIGMFDLSTYLKSQMCTWIGRAFRSPIDNWQYDLMLRAPAHNISLIRPLDVPADQHPILHNFVCAFKEFYGDFTRCDSNYKEAYIFDNPVFRRGPDFTRTIDQSLFGNLFYETYRDRIRCLKYSDCFNNFIFKDPEEFHSTH